MAGGLVRSILVSHRSIIQGVKFNAGKWRHLATPAFCSLRVLIGEKFLKLSRSNIVNSKYCFVEISICPH
jgi:hypothetical protein